MCSRIVIIAAEYLKKHNPTPERYAAAVDRFMRSTAACSVATFLLGVGDRHNDNIMVTRSGLQFHIDFSKFLGKIQKWGRFKRERGAFVAMRWAQHSLMFATAPFVLTHEFVYVFCEGDKDSTEFKRFVTLCCDAFNVLRAHARLITAVFELMLSSGIANLRRSDLGYLSRALALELSNDEASAAFESLIFEALASISTRANFAIHAIANSRKRK